MHYYRDFYSPVLWLFVDGSLNAVKLWIYGSSVIKTTLREPRFLDILVICQDLCPWHSIARTCVLDIPFRTVSSTFHCQDLCDLCPWHSIQDSVFDIPLRTFIQFRNIGVNCLNRNYRLTIGTSLDGEWWIILYGSLKLLFFIVVVPFFAIVCADCGYSCVLLYWVRYFGTGIRWLITLRLLDEALLQIFSPIGTPKEILSDWGTQFTSPTNEITTNFWNNY